MSQNKVDSPYFSIVIPLYNKEKYILNTLKSVLKQIFIDYEIIIVNDGSNDSSISIVNSLELNNLTLIHQKNSGVSVARNKGIEIAKGKFIAFLDADDYWYPNHLQELYESTLIFPSESVFCTNYEMELRNNKIKNTRFSIPIKSKHTVITDYFSASYYSSIASTPSISIRKKILNDDFKFDPKIKSGQDTDLWIKLALVYNFVFNNTITVKHVKHAKFSLSKSNFIFDRYKLIEKHSKSEKTRPSLKKYLDLNRFSIALAYKRDEQFDKYQEVSKQIKLFNLPIRRIIILYMPLKVIRFLDKIKNLL